MSLKDRKVIVTGGPTREWLDPVRFISNPSSGKMGIAIADCAHERGAETVFIHGPVNDTLVDNKVYRTRKIESTSDLLEAVIHELADGSILIMSAAPADYTPADKSPVKIKKNSDELVLTLKRTPDILKAVAAFRAEGRVKDVFVVGFAAETNDIEDYALEKLQTKNLDMICLNDVSARGAGFGTDTNIITIYKKNGGKVCLDMMAKHEAARKILEEIEVALQ